MRDHLHRWLTWLTGDGPAPPSSTDGRGRRPFAQYCRWHARALRCLLVLAFCASTAAAEEKTSLDSELARLRPPPDGHHEAPLGSWRVLVEYEIETYHPWSRAGQVEAWFDSLGAGRIRRIQFRSGLVAMAYGPPYGLVEERGWSSPSDMRQFMSDLAAVLRAEDYAGDQNAVALREFSTHDYRSSLVVSLTNRRRPVLPAFKYDGTRSHVTGSDGPIIQSRIRAWLAHQLVERLLRRSALVSCELGAHEVKQLADEARSLELGWRWMWRLDVLAWRSGAGVRDVLSEQRRRAAREGELVLAAKTCEHRATVLANRDVLAALRRQLRSANPWHRLWAQSRLGELDEVARRRRISSAVRSADPQVRGDAIAEWIRAGGDGEDLVRAPLDDRDPIVRLLAAKLAIDRVGGKLRAKGEGVLLAIAQSSADSVRGRFARIEAIESLCGGVTLRSDAAAIRRVLIGIAVSDEEDDLMRRMAVRGLGWLGSEEVIGSLRSCLVRLLAEKDVRLELVKELATCLGILRDGALVPLLPECLKVGVGVGTVSTALGRIGSEGSLALIKAQDVELWRRWTRLSSQILDRDFDKVAGDLGPMSRDDEGWLAGKLVSMGMSRTELISLSRRSPAMRSVCEIALERLRRVNRGR